METKITIIAIGLAFIVTVRNFMIQQLEKGRLTDSPIQIIKDAFKIIKEKIKRNQ